MLAIILAIAGLVSLQPPISGLFVKCHHVARAKYKDWLIGRWGAVLGL